MVDEPRARSTAPRSPRPAFQEIMRFALPYLRHRAGLTGRGAARAAHRLTRAMTLRDVLGEPGRAPTSRSPRLRLRQPPGRARHACSSACAASRATATSSPPTPSRAAPSRSSSTTRSASACPRSSSRTCAPRWRPPPRALHGDPDRDAADRRRHRDERQDDDRLPRARAARGGRAARPGCSAPSRRSSAASSATVARTTPEAIDLQATFAAMLDAGDTHCAMEVSTHALALGRADAIHWAAAIFTNLTQDHLDFHPTMEDYFAAKRRLFEARPRRRRSSTSTIRTARGWPRELGGRRRSTVRDRRAGRRPARDATCVRTSAARRSRAGGAGAALAAAGALQRAQRARRGRGRARAGRRRRDDRRRAAGAPAACPGASSRSTRGRTSRCSSTTPTRPTRWRTCCAAARPLTRGRLLCVFGCGGDRDRGKRPLMGEIAARLADRGDRHLRQPALRGPRGDRRRDPRPGSPDRSATEAIVDRREAIERAVGLAGAGDVVVIAGKGHEQGQEFEGGRKVPFDDVTVAREALRARLVALSGSPRPAGRAARRAAGARLAAPAAAARGRARGDDRLARGRPGDLFVGLPGANVDGGCFAVGALARRRLGRARLAGLRRRRAGRRAGVVLVADDPLAALQALATAWRRELGAQVVAITGSTGKTSTKDLLAAMLAPGPARRRHRRRTSTPRSGCR